MFYKPNKYSIHAEDICIRKCKDKSKLKDTYMILVRIDNKKNNINCNCCDMCKKKINKYNIKKVYYINN